MNIIRPQYACLILAMLALAPVGLDAAVIKEIKVDSKGIDLPDPGFVLDLHRAPGSATTSINVKSHEMSRPCKKRPVRCQSRTHTHR